MSNMLLKGQGSLSITQWSSSLLLRSWVVLLREIRDFQSPSNCSLKPTILVSSMKRISEYLGSNSQEECRASCTKKWYESNLEKSSQDKLPTTLLRRRKVGRWSDYQMLSDRLRSLITQSLQSTPPTLDRTRPSSCQALWLLTPLWCRIALTSSQWQVSLRK